MSLIFQHKIDKDIQSGLVVLIIVRFLKEVGLGGFPTAYAKAADEIFLRTKKYE
jgi:hypothetical protein